jgi:hypothetical protein
MNLEMDSVPLTEVRKIPCRRELLIRSLQRFYASREDMSEIIPLLQGQGDISLRVMDWFVTNYAKKHNVSYPLAGQEFGVYLNYKSQLKAFSKKLFDPFCRRERIQFQVGTSEPFVTTVGQLNFFRWAFEKEIFPYIRTHYQEILRDEKMSRTPSGTQSSTGSMSTVTTATTLTVDSAGSVKSRRRRTEKVPSSAKCMHKHDTEIVLSFN